MTDFLPTNHTFAVCAYKENQFLEACVKSVVAQKEKTNVIICTPTPNDFIKAVAENYDLPLYVNPDPQADMQGSWNFALQTAQTDFVTVCHQDDYYDPDYYSTVKEYFSDDLLYLHTNYKNAFTDINGNTEIKASKNILFKRMIHFFFANRWQQESVFFKRWDLRFGNSVCCPTCTYNKKNLDAPLFISRFQHGVDWDLYIKLASRNGRVAYVKKPIAFKRIHADAQTKSDVMSGVRAKEDIELYSLLWPDFIARLLQRVLLHFYNAG